MSEKTEIKISKNNDPVFYLDEIEVIEIPSPDPDLVHVGEWGMAKLIRTFMIPANRLILKSLRWLSRRKT